MMMMKSAVFSLLMLAFAVPATYAALTELPEGYLDGWGGRSSYFQDLGGGQVVHGRIEFAVYNTAQNPGFEAPGGRQYLYAYQIFNDGSLSTAAVTYFALLGINPSAIQSDDDIGTNDENGGAPASDARFSLTKESAVFEFEDGLLVVGAKSAYLLIGSDAAPIVGSYTIKPQPDDNIPVPGGDDNPIPEPATLILLAGGALTCLRKRRR